MAYVSISNGLISSTQNNIREMRNKEKATQVAPPETTTVPDEDGNMYALIWGDHIHLRNQIPDSWKQRPGHITLRCQFSVDSDPEKKYKVDLRVNAAAGFECPRSEQNQSSYYGPMYVVPEGSHLLPQAGRELVAHRKFCRETDLRWEVVEQKVRQFLNSAKSLNEALKLWPGLSMYVNKDYLDRVALKVKIEKKEKPKTSAEELLGTLDVDTLTAAAVASKLTV